MISVSTDPGELFSRSFGHGPRQVLALHCTIAHSGAWRGLARILEDEATFIAPDMFSHGRSPDWDGTGDFPDLLTKAITPLLDKPMDLIGHSFGAVIALRMAVEQPHLVRTLTLIEPVFFAVSEQDVPETVDHTRAKVQPVFDAIARGDTELAARLFNRGWGETRTRWLDLPEASRAAMARGIHIVPGCDSAIHYDRPGLLKPGVLDALHMPTLLLRGDETEERISLVNDGLARRIPGALNVVIKGAGHMLPLTHPNETATHLRRLFAQAKS